MSETLNATERSNDPSDPGVEQELTSRLLRRNMGVRSLLLLIWPIYAVLDAGRTPWWLFVVLAGLHVVGRLGYPRLERNYAAHAESQPLSYWQNLHFALTLWNGLVVGVGGAMVALSADPPVLFSLCLLLIILALGSPSRAYSARSYTGYVVALLLPMSVALASTGDRLAIILGVACLPPFGLGLLLVARGQQRFAREMIAVTLSHERLLGRFEIARGEGEEARTTLRTALNALSEAVFLYAPDGRLLLLNDAAYQIHGIDRQQPLIGRNFREFLEVQVERGDFGPLDASTRVAAIAARMEQFNRGTDGWLLVRRRDRWLELSTTVLPDGHRLIVHRDVTDLKNSETAETKARETLQAALNALSDAVILYSPEKRLLFINDVARQTLGDLPAERLIGGTMRELVERQIDVGVFGPLDPDERAAAIALREELLENGTKGWLQLRRRDRWLEVSVVILTDGRRLVVHRDITDLKNSETAAKEAGAKLIAAMESIAGGIAFLDADERLELCNEAFKRFMDDDPLMCMPGASLEVGTRRGAEKKLPPERREEWVETAMHRYRTGEPVLVPFGDDRWARLLMRPTGDGRWTLLATDVTEQRQRQRELEQALSSATESRAKLIAAMETMAGGIAFLDADERLELCNEAFKRFMNDDPLMCTPGVTLESACRQGATRLPPEIREQSIVEGLRRYRTGESVLIPFGDKRWARMEMCRTGDGRWTLLATDVTGERQRQRELEAALATANEAQAKLMAAMETMAGGIAFFDADERIEMCNEAFRRFMSDDPFVCQPGTSLEASTRLASEALPPQSREEWVQTVLRRYRSGESVLLRFGERGWFRRAPDPASASSAQGWARLVMRPTGDGRWTMLATDVTEQRQRQRELEAALTAANEAQAKLIAAMETMAGGIAFLDAKERLELCNEAFKRFMNDDPLMCTPGVTLEGGIRQGALRLPPERREEAIESALRRYRAGEPIVTQFGDNRYARMVMRYTSDGRSTLLVTDVTEQRQRQHELEAALAAATDSRGKLVAAMGSMADGIAFFDAEDRLELCNEAYKRFMGNNPELFQEGIALSNAVVIAAYAGAVPAEQTAEWIASALLNLRTGDPILFRWGKGQWARALARSIQGRTTLLVTDVTEQRRRQRELERALESAETARAESDAANQAKSTFLATMSHEIRTPMNGVLGMIEVLGRERLNDDQRDLVHTMRDSAGAVLRLLDDLLDFSKIEAGRTDLEAAAFSLSSVVERAADNFRAAATAKGVSLSVAMSPGSADALIGDPTRVRQIVANLIGNAVKFTQRGAVIVRALTRPLGEGRTEVEITVNDTGIGMDEAQLAGLFKPFAQADSGTTRRYGGTGLGLSIVRRLAQLMEGDVTAQSAPGAGSTFTVTLVLLAAPADSPLIELQAQSGPTVSGAPVAPALQSRARVLVVDDHPVNLKVALRQLASLGVAADTAADGREGLERWRAGDYALILADVHMPDMDGFEMTALIRADEARRGLPRTPIVASTANAMKGEDERCRAAGMDGYLSKPVETERLRAVIERWLPAAEQPAEQADAESCASGDDAEILDRAVLARWSGGDATFERDLVETFTGEMEQSKRDIDAAMRAGDLARTAQAAHRLKGSALQIGAKRAGAAALMLEEAGKAADRQRCQDARGHLAAELRRLMLVLQSVGGTNM